MTIFTDVRAALEEAEYLADKTGKPHAIVRDSEQPAGMRVMSHKRACDDGREIVKVCAHPMEDAA